MRNRSSRRRKVAPVVPVPAFTPVERRERHDGWTPERQHDFVRALAESGCVSEACGAVGMSPSSAYRLRAQPAATAFRQAWDVALDYAIRRLSDAAFSRALHGVSRPVFYKGEQVGERRYFDERLTQFLLRYRDPVRYGRWLDGYEARRHPDGAGITLAHALNAVTGAAYGAQDYDLAPDVEEGDGDAADDAPIDPAAPDFHMPAALDRGPPPAAGAGDDNTVEEEDIGPDHPDYLKRAMQERLREKAERRAYWDAVAAGRDPDAPVTDPDDVSADWDAPLTVRRPIRAPPA